MPTPPLPAHKLQAVRDLLSKGNRTHQSIASEVGVARGTVGNIARQMKDDPAAAVEPAPERITKAAPIETSEVVGNQWNISLPRTRISTLEELLEHCKVDQRTWSVERWSCNKWEMGLGTGPANDRSVIVEPLFQVKATLRRRQNIAFALAEIEQLKAEAKAASPFPSIVVRPNVAGGLMLEVNLTDAHLGKLAWAYETGYQSYDTSIAEETYLRALETIVDRVKGYVFEQIIFVVGNDITQADNKEGQTTKGTRVDVDSRYQKVFSVTRRMLTAAIERLRRLGPVKVIVVSGNHDALAAWHLGHSLECYFHRYEDVEIDNTPVARKYHQFGRVMIMLTHGDKGKRQDYPLLMATERPQMFGETVFREAHTGHNHATKAEEYHGVRVRTLPALCPPDAWHADNGFVGNLRTAEAMVWSRTEGLIATVYHNEDAVAA